MNAAKTRDRIKRGSGEAIRVPLEDVAEMTSAVDRCNLVALDDALRTLEALNPRESQVVELRFFGGLSLEEIAEVLHVSVGTVRRDWTLARAWLFRELSGANRS